MNEQSILGCLLIDESAYPRIKAKIKAEYFEESKHRIIFRTISKLNEKGVPVDTLTLVQELRKTNDVESAGGVAYISGLLRNTVSARNVEAYAQDLAENYVQRKLVVYNNEVNLRLKEPFNTIDEINQQMKDCEQALQILTGLDTTTLSLQERVIERLQNYYNNKNKTDVQTYESNIRAFDGAIRIDKGDLVIIGARPAMGKTALMLQLCRNYAKKGMKCIIFSLEMTAQKLTDRIIISEAVISNDRYRKGELYKDEEVKLNTIGKKLEGCNIVIQDKPLQAIYDIESMTLIEQPDIIFIDYLSLISTPDKDTRNNEIGAITRGLKKLAKRADIPIVVLHQLSRAVEKRQDKRPILSDLRDSGEIEQDADIVLFLYREKYYFPEKDCEQAIEMIIGKYREGASGTFVKLYHDEQISNIGTEYSSNNIDF